MTTMLFDITLYFNKWDLMRLVFLLLQDFGDTIPGHGGIMDRFDCQFLMATFVHVYHSSFVRSVHTLG